MSAGETVSIRVPPGAKEELKAATGLPFSTVVRHIIMAMLAYYRQERKEHEAKKLGDEAKVKIAEITESALRGGVQSDD